jgi:cytochrome b
MANTPLENEQECQSNTPSIRELNEFLVWDKSIRWLHWINVLCVLSLMVVGTIILNADTLGVSGEGKISLKILHAWVGYVFAVNLLYRIFWGFIGNKYARWRAILPVGKNYMVDLKGHIGGIRSGKIPAYRGHSPLGRLMVTFLILLLLTQMTAGLVIAGTDLYFPPFGHDLRNGQPGQEKITGDWKGLSQVLKRCSTPKDTQPCGNFVSLSLRCINFHFTYCCLPSSFISLPL